MTNGEDIKRVENDDTKFHHHSGSKVAMIIGLLLVVGASGLVLGAMANHFNVRRNQTNCFHDDLRGGYGMMGTGRHMGGYGRFGIENETDDSIGTYGEVTKIEAATVTINNGKSDTTVNISPTTSYIKFGKIAKQSDLKIGNSIMAYGTSDSNGILSATRIIIK
jgi:hypothetical protein